MSESLYTAFCLLVIPFWRFCLSAWACVCLMLSMLVASRSALLLLLLLNVSLCDSCVCVSLVHSSCAHQKCVSAYVRMRSESTNDRNRLQVLSSWNFQNEKEPLKEYRISRAIAAATTNQPPTEYMHASIALLNPHIQFICHLNFKRYNSLLYRTTVYIAKYAHI